MKNESKLKHDYLFFFVLELYGRDLVKQATRVSNPGCYATNTQLLLAPLMPHLDKVQMPSIFGVSGFSGAGTKSGEKDAEGRPKTVPKIVRCVFLSLSFVIIGRRVNIA